MRPALLFLSIMFAASHGEAWGQVSRTALDQPATGVLIGSVSNARTGLPIAANVYLVGTRYRTASTESGKYRLAGMPAGEYTLTVQMLGFARASRSVSVVAGRETNVDVALEPVATTLGDVVVTGTVGSAERRTLGNSVVSVDAPEAIARSGTADIGTMINGRVPGAVVVSGSGLLGAGPSINIRGRSTLSLSQQPLIYIDGVRVDNDAGTGPLTNGALMVSRLNDVNPEDIERIEVIKGPAAATLYGTEASNGGIQIVTKRGRPQTSDIDFSTRQGSMWFMDAADRIRTNYAKDPKTGQILSWNGVKQEDARGTPFWTNGDLQTYSLRFNG